MRRTHVPESKGGPFRKIAGVLLRFSTRRWVKYGFSPLLMVSIPSLTILFLTREPFHAWLFGSEPTQTAAFVVWATIVVILLPVILRLLWALVEWVGEPDRRLEIEDVVSFVNLVRPIIGDKIERFSACARRIAKVGKLDASDVFREITQPDSQIRSLVRMTLVYFSSLDTDTSYRAGMLSVVNGRPFEWIAYFPDGKTPRTTPSELCAPSSTAMRAIEKGRLVVVGDIQKELKKKIKEDRSYCKGRTESDEEGSQLCYPVHDSVTKDVVYVLSIAGNRKGCLDPSLASIYEWMLEQFGTRIQLEHCLKNLRGLTDEKRAGVEGQGLRQIESNTSGAGA